MLFRRRPDNSLPTFGGGGGGGGLGGGHPDGSGRAIHMDAPIVRTWKKSSSFTRRTYYCLVGFLFLAIFGFLHIRYSHASIWLNCTAEKCLLQVTPSGAKGTKSLTLSRRQLVDAKVVKTDRTGGFLQVHDPRQDFYDPVGRKKGKKKGSATSKGPDENGHYTSYWIVLKDPKKLAEEDEEKEPDNYGSRNKDGETFPDADLTSIQEFLVDFDPNTGERALVFRKFGMTQTPRRSRTNTNKLDSYIKNRRHTVGIKENAMLSWQGLLMMLLGIIGLLLTLVIGQLWDGQHDYANYAGPGVRRTNHPTSPTGKRRNPPSKPLTRRPAAGSNRMKSY